MIKKVEVYETRDQAWRRYGSLVMAGYGCIWMHQIDEARFEVTYYETERD